MGKVDFELDPNLQNELETAAYHLNHSGVVAFPTETVMGLGVVYDDEFAYHRLNHVKRRPEDKPYSLMVQNTKQIPLFAEVDERSKKIIDAFLPGPLTILMPVKEKVPTWVTHGGKTIGIRVSSDPVTEALLGFVGKPLLVPSANRSGEKPTMTGEEAKAVFQDEIDYVVEGSAKNGKPSTIIDVTGEEIKLVRQGEITLQEIMDAVNGKGNKMKIAVGSDHGGYLAKEEVKKYLAEEGYEVVDVGTDSTESCHYPLFGGQVGILVANHECAYGVVICSSGEGIAMAANKIKGIRCGIGYNDDVARLLRQHNNANVIAFGAKFMSVEDIIRRIHIFLHTDFEGGRHQTRVEMISDLEK